MRSTTFWCAVILMAQALWLQAAHAAQAGSDSLSHAIFIKVNGKSITRQNVEEAVKYILRREYNDEPPNDMTELENVQKAALRDLVRTILIHDEASTYNLKVDRRFTQRAIAESGMKPEEISPTIRRMLEADELFSDIMLAEGTPISNPTPREMRDFYNRNRDQFRSNAMVIVRTIFIADEGRFSTQFYQEKAQRLMNEINAAPAGQARTDVFDKLARENSQDVFAQFGGMLTAESPQQWIPKDFDNKSPEGRDVFPSQMVDAIRNLSYPGEVRMAQSEEGFHLIYCQDAQGGDVMPWEQAMRIIEYVLMQRQKNTRMASWLGRIYDRSDVRWHDGKIYPKNQLSEVLLPSERSTASQLH